MRNQNIRFDISFVCWFNTMLTVLLPFVTACTIINDFKQKQYHLEKMPCRKISDLNVGVITFIHTFSRSINALL